MKGFRVFETLAAASAIVLPFTIRPPSAEAALRAATVHKPAVFKQTSQQDTPFVPDGWCANTLLPNGKMVAAAVGSVSVLDDYTITCEAWKAPVHFVLNQSGVADNYGTVVSVDRAAEGVGQIQTQGNPVTGADQAEAPGMQDVQPSNQPAHTVAEYQVDLAALQPNQIFIPEMGVIATIMEGYAAQIPGHPQGMWIYCQGGRVQLVASPDQLPVGITKAQVPETRPGYVVVTVDHTTLTVDQALSLTAVPIGLNEIVSGGESQNAVEPQVFSSSRLPLPATVVGQLSRLQNNGDAIGYFIPPNPVDLGESGILIKFPEGYIRLDSFHPYMLDSAGNLWRYFPNSGEYKMYSPAELEEMRKNGAVFLGFETINCPPLDWGTETIYPIRTIPVVDPPINKPMPGQILDKDGSDGAKEAVFRAGSSDCSNPNKPIGELPDVLTVLDTNGNQRPAEPGEKGTIIGVNKSLLGGEASLEIDVTTNERDFDLGQPESGSKLKDTLGTTKSSIEENVPQAAAALGGVSILIVMLLMGANSLGNRWGSSLDADYKSSMTRLRRH